MLREIVMLGTSAEHVDLLEKENPTKTTLKFQLQMNEEFHYSEHCPKLEPPTHERKNWLSGRDIWTTLI